MRGRARLGRRALFGLPTLLALSGCGFHPLYAPSATGTSVARSGLGQISVALIPERTGQLLRQALQARFDHGDAPIAKKYDLVVGFGIGQEALGIERDNGVTRVRFVGKATWSLLSRDARRATVTSGSARAVDGLNTFDQQYFAQDLESEAVQRRVADAVADQISTQLAYYFDKHPA
jgi:LPS-assembly lipoprotein